MKLTLLGTGDVRQVPVYGCTCMACERARKDSAFVRRPTSALLESEGRLILIDAGLTDLGERFPPGSLKAMLLTHYHVDHVQGLFHLRWGVNTSIPVYGPDDPDGCADLYRHPGILDFQPSPEAFQPFSLGALTVTPVPLQHSKPTFGYLLEEGSQAVAYLTDTRGLPQETEDFLHTKRIQAMVLDCSLPPGPASYRNHNDLDMALAIRTRVKPERLVLTHIGHHLDQWLMAHSRALPDGVIAGQDGLVVFDR